MRIRKRNWASKASTGFLLGKLTLLISDIKAPNGIAFSPDEKKPYLSDVDYTRAAWRVYDVTADGKVRNGRIFADASKWKKGTVFWPGRI